MTAASGGRETEGRPTLMGLAGQESGSARRSRGLVLGAVAVAIGIAAVVGLASRGAR
jgi:hypothetical protein